MCFAARLPGRGGEGGDGAFAGTSGRWPQSLTQPHAWPAGGSHTSQAASLDSAFISGVDEDPKWTLVLVVPWDPSSSSGADFVPCGSRPSPRRPGRRRSPVNERTNQHPVQ